MTIHRIPTLLGSVALFSALALASYSGVSPQDQFLKDSDLKRLAQSLADYIEARVEEKGVSDATGDVASNMEKLERKLAKTAAQGDILASPGDLGRAVWLSYDYGRNRPKKGKVADRKFVGSVFSKDNPLLYAVWAPSKYSASSGPYPLIITIPDEGIRPADHLRDQWTEGGVQDGAILASPVMPEDASAWAGRDGIGRVIVLMRAIYEEYGVDFNRIPGTCDIRRGGNGSIRFGGRSRVKIISIDRDVKCSVHDVLHFVQISERMYELPDRRARDTIR